MPTQNQTWQDIPKKIRMTISASVARGARLLDKERPGWQNEIDEGKLRMQSPCNCVYGQLDAVDVFEAKLLSLGYTPYEKDYYFGYALPDSVWELARKGRYKIIDAAWAWLQEEWLRAIYLRREVVKVARGEL